MGRNRLPGEWPAWLAHLVAAGVVAFVALAVCGLVAWVVEALR